MRILTFLPFLFVMLAKCAMAASLHAEHWTTTTGVPVIFYQAMEVPMLDISIAFAAGSAYDKEAFGLSSMTTHLLNRGSRGLDADLIAEKLATTGAQYQAASSQDMVVVNLRTLTAPKALKEASELFTAIVSHPDFKESELHQEKTQQLMAIAETQEIPDSLANQTFYQILYKQHPYAHPVLGTEERVKQLKISDVRRFYQQFFVARNAIIVLVGAIDKSKAQALAEQITHDLATGEKAPEIPTAEAFPEALDIEVKFPSSQTFLRIGQLGISHNDKHYFPLMVGNYILGGGALVSRLATELRENRGLTYGVSSQFSPMPGKGPFLISLTTKNSQAHTATQITRDTLKMFVEKGPSEEELIAAKRYLSGSFPLSLANNRSIADMLIKIAFYHLPDDYLQTYVERINAVTVEDIRTAFQELVKPKQLLQVSVGNKVKK